MEIKDYQKKVSDLKNEILDEIRKILPIDSRHKFKEPFFVHFIDGEMAKTEICLAVELWSDETVVFCVSKNENATIDEEEIVEAVYNYDTGSFVDILSNLRRDIRESKLEKLIDIVANNNGIMQFDGSFEFLCDDTEQNSESDLSHSTLVGFELVGKGNLLVKTIWKEDGASYDYNQGCICDAELDNILKFVEKQVKKTFKITVKEVLSRIYEVEATCYDDAAQMVKGWIEDNPLSIHDSDGIFIDDVRFD